LQMENYRYPRGIGGQPLVADLWLGDQQSSIDRKPGLLHLLPLLPPIFYIVFNLFFGIMRKFGDGPGILRGWMYITLIF
jgi:hypothetical protein